MTLDEIIASEKNSLSPSDVCEVLGCHPYSINVQAKEDITKLGFPASLIRNRVHIPRIGFLNWYMGGKKTC